MSTTAKILVVVNLALAAAFVGSASTYLGNQDHWQKKHERDTAKLREELDRKQKALDEQTQAKDTALAGQRAALENEGKATARAEQLELENKHLRSAYDQKNAQLTEATGAMNRMSGTLASNQDLINQLKDQNRAQYEALITTRDALNKAREQVDRLALQLTNETEKGKGLESQIANLSEDLERANFELQAWNDKYPGGGIMGAAQPAHSGQVLAADNPNNVFVISLGAEDGVEKGFEYTVSRGAQYVATFVITDVQSKQSAAMALKDLSKGPIQRGDTVRSAR